MDGEYKWTYINGVVSILRKVMGDKTITTKETALVLDMLGVFGRNDLVHEYKGVKQYNKENIRSYFERNVGRIKRFLFDIRPKPKPEKFEHKPYLQVNPMLKVPPREPSEMEIASNELLAADEVFYENNEHRTRGILKYYRGFTGNKPHRENGIWLTPNIECAMFYIEDCDGGHIGEYFIDDSKLMSADTNTVEDICGYPEGEFEPIDGLSDNDKKLLLQNGYNAYEFAMESSDILYLFSNEPLISYRILSDEEINQQLNENKHHKNNITMNKIIKLNESELKSFINGTVKRILKESYDTDRQWKSELQAFMRGLRNGEAEISGNTVYVQIWKSRTASNDPRYVYYRRGENRLHDDHFYVQDSPRLSARTINAINKRLGWGGDDEYDF